MFEIAGLFLDDRSEAHLEAVSSLSQYLDGLLGEDLNENALFAMQKQTYDIHAIGVNSLERAVMTERSFDCKGGCDSCCHATDVGLTPSELFYLSNHIPRRIVKYCQQPFFLLDNLDFQTNFYIQKWR